MCENVGGKGAGDLLQVLMQEFAFSVPIKKLKNYIKKIYELLLFKFSKSAASPRPAPLRGGGGGGGKREKTHIYYI